jgi:O-antigen/teichoic acid export membrane protein
MASGPAVGLRVSVASLFTAYVVSFIVVGLSYLLYSRLLSPAEFGLYSAALVIASFGQLLLDGGLKNTLIKSRLAFSPVVEGTLMSLMLAAAAAIATGLLLGWLSRAPEASSGRDQGFLAAFAAIFLVAYPLLVFPTARLERAFRYRRLAWIETCGGIIERAGPALLILLGAGLWSFVGALAAAMAFRAAALAVSAPVRPCLPTPARVRVALAPLTEGAWFQVGVGANLVRDGLHVLLVGPMFGAAWIGYYGWAMQLARIASQAFVQVAARVSLPLFAQSVKRAARWRACLGQVELLAMATSPLLGACLVVVPSVDVTLFHDRWAPAVAILPFLFLRMVPSMATTPVGTLLLVEAGARWYTLCVWAWTAVELAGAVVLLAALGPVGLAVSSAAMVWPGLLILAWAMIGAADQRLLELLRALLFRPSLAITVLGVAIAQIGLSAWFVASNRGHVAALLFAGTLLAAAYLSEARLRALLRALLRAVLRAVLRPRGRDGDSSPQVEAARDRAS